MDKEISEKIKKTLTSLILFSRVEAQKSNVVFFLRDNSEHFVRLYEEDGVVASLTHSILFNKGAAHSFCCTLSDVKSLWSFKEVQLAFAEALCQGDTLLIDAITFIPEYRDIPEIQEAIAYNISTCSSIFFQINTACSGLGLCSHPSIKKAILGRKKDIIRMVKTNWHESVFVTIVPYLMEDEEIRKVFFDLKPKILLALKEDKGVFDVAILLKNVDWIQNDPEIIGAVRDRFLDKTIEYDYTLAHTLEKCGLLQKYSVLRETLDTWKS